MTAPATSGIVSELDVSDAGPLSFHYEGVCAYESTFDYSG